MNKNIERRMYNFEVRAERTESGEAILTGKPIVFGRVTDLGFFDEMIAPGAIDESAMKDVRFLVNHDEKMIPLARSRNNNENSTMKLSVDNEGMNIDWLKLDVERNATARELESAVDRGDLDGMSFMFNVEADEWQNLESDHPLRIIKRISNIYELSAVTFPAYEDTVINVRNKEALDNAKAALDNARRSLDSDKEKDSLLLEKLKMKYLL